LSNPRCLLRRARRRALGASPSIAEIVNVTSAKCAAHEIKASVCCLQASASVGRSTQPERRKCSIRQRHTDDLVNGLPNDGIVDAFAIIALPHVEKAFPPTIQVSPVPTLPTERWRGIEFQEPRQAFVLAEFLHLLQA
jgi:hypothetical protein